MGRPALVDRDIALDRLMLQFWRAGYEASSLDDLLAASGLARASFYREFGDKRAAFLAALRHYQRKVVAAHIRPALADGDLPIRRLRRFLYRRLDAALGLEPKAPDERALRPGCFIVNTAIELASHDPEIGKIVSRGLDGIRATIRALVQAVIDRGEATDGIDADRAALQLHALLQGVNVLARAGAPRRELRHLLRRTVATVLGLA